MLTPTVLPKNSYQLEGERTSMILQVAKKCFLFWGDVATVLFFKPSFDEVSTVLNSSVVRASSTAYRGSPPIVRTGGLRV